VTNAGARAGEEVAQLYAAFKASAVDRPVKLLRGFAKVLLQPGETQTVQFSLKAQDLAYWDTASGTFRVEPVPYELLVGGSSRRGDLLSATVRVTARPETGGSSR
jgi:beta-glucosidase